MDLYGLYALKWVVFNRFLLLHATDASKNSSNRYRSPFGISIYPLMIWIVLTWFPSKISKLFALTLDSLPKYQTWLSSGGSVFLSNKVNWGWILRIWAASKIWDAAQTWLVSLNLYQCFKIWAGAQFEPVFGGSATRFKFFKFGLWYLFFYSLPN